LQGEEACPLTRKHQAVTAVRANACTAAHERKQEMSQQENETRKVGKEANQRPTGMRQEQFD
jgi:hypothetical protein